MPKARKASRKNTTANTSQEMKMPTNLTELEKMLSMYLVDKAPALPVGFKEVLVKIAPYLAIVSVVVSVPSILSMLSASRMISRSMYWAIYSTGFGYHYYVALITMVAVTILQGLAIPGLFSRTKQAWNYLFYAMLVSALSSLLQLNLLSMVIGFLISGYFLFQLRSYYTGKAK